jgi:adenine-specific DNA-methyltransferase
MPTLNWLTREQDLKTAANTEYRLLVEDEKYSYGDSDSGNLIVQGDNLEALKALLPFYAGQVKCIYIDPPYNTGSAFEHYDDNMEHTIWLSVMYPRLELLRDFLSKDGVIFIQIDDTEYAYLKIITDEIFGRGKTDCLIWRKSGAGRDGKMKNTTTFRKDHEYIIVAFKGERKLNKSFEKPVWENSYPNPDNDPRGNYKAGSISRQENASNPNHKNYYTVISPSGKEFTRQFDVPKEEFEKLNTDNRIYWGKNLDAVPAVKIFENEERETNTSSLILNNGTSTEGKKEIEDLFGDIQAFATPKPEILIKKIIQISTQPGDLILDSFLGSGTTAAVAHKMGRRYIGIEIGEQAKTHCVARLKKVIEGEDQGGISKSVGWKGGDGFRFFTLGDAVFDKDRRIKEDISFENLAAHIYFTETKKPMTKQKKNSTFLGIHEDTAYALLYNGILGDKSVNGGNVLTHKTLNHIMNDIDAAAKKNKAELKYNQMVIYGEATRLNVSQKFNNIIFKQTPYDIKVW